MGLDGMRDSSRPPIIFICAFISSKCRSYSHAACCSTKSSGASRRSLTCFQLSCLELGTFEMSFHSCLSFEKSHCT